MSFFPLLVLGNGLALKFRGLSTTYTLMNLET